MIRLNENTYGSSNDGSSEGSYITTNSKYNLIKSYGKERICGSYLIAPKFCNTPFFGIELLILLLISEIYN